MSTNFYTVFSVVSFVLLSWILFGFKFTLLLFVLTAICAFLLDESREWKSLLPVRLELLSLAKPVTSGARSLKQNVRHIGSLLYTPVNQGRGFTMFDSWNPLQWLWKGSDSKNTGSARSVTRSKFVRRPSKSAQTKKKKENPLNLTAPISKSTPKSPRKGYAPNMSFDDHNTSVSVLNASGPLLSTPMMPMIKRAVANTPGHNDTFSPDLNSPAGNRSRPVRRANTFHFTPTHPVESSPGVLPWVRFGRRDRHSLYKADVSSLKRHNTVRVAPPDPHRVHSPSVLTPLKERSDNTPQPVDTRAVVNALRERRKRSLPVAMEEDSFFEDAGQHAKRRRQESSQSTASSASLPPMPDHLPDLSDKNVMMQLDQASLKRPPAPSREAFEEAEFDACRAKRQKNTRNNPIISSLSSSKKNLIKERIEAKRKVSDSERDTDTTQMKRKATDLTPVMDETSLSMLQSNDDVIGAASAMEDSQPDKTQHTEAISNKDDTQTSTPSSQSSTPNKRMQMEGISKPTRRRNMSIYPGLNTSFADVPLARVTATAEDYEVDREAERQRVQDMLEDVETSIKKGNKPGIGILGPTSTSTTSSSTASSTTAPSTSQTTATISVPTLKPAPSVTANITASLLTTQTLSNPLLSNPLLSTVTPQISASTTSSSHSSTTSTAVTTTVSSQPEFTFKPIFGGATSTASSAAGTSTTSSVQSPVSSTTLTGFNPVFPPVSSVVATSGGTGTSGGLGVTSSKPETQMPSLGFSLSQSTSASISSAPQSLFTAQTATNTSNQTLGIQPLTTSTPKPTPQSGFSLGGSAGFQFGQTNPAATTAATASSQTGISAAPGNFSFGQNPVSTSQNLAFGATGAPSLPSYTQAASVAAGQISGTPALPSYTQATAGQGTGNSTPARTLFGTGPAASATTAAGPFLFGQTTPATNASTALPFGQTTPATNASTALPFGQTTPATNASTALPFGQTSNSTNASATTFQFGQSNTSATTASRTISFGQGNSSTATTQSASFAFGTTPQSMPKTQAVTTASGGLFNFGSTSATPGGTAGFGGAGTATAFGSGTAAPTFGSGQTSAPGFGSGSASTFGSGTSSFGTGSSGQGFGAGSATPATGFGTASGTSATGFGTGSSTTVQGTTGSSTFAFGATSAPVQPGFGSTTPSTGSVFGSTQPASSNVFGTTPASQDQKQSSVFGTPAKQTGFNFGATSSSFSAGTQPAFGQSGSGFGNTAAPSQGSASGTFQFGQTQSGQQGGGENKGFNFNASFTGTPQISFGTPSTPAQPSFGTPTSNMFNATGSAVPPKPRVAARGGRRRGMRR